METVGQKGQHYINSETGAEFECVEVNEDGYIWNPVEDGKSRQTVMCAGVRIVGGNGPLQYLPQIGGGHDACGGHALGALGNAETTLADVDARLGLLELMYRTQVNGNPFTVSFSLRPGPPGCPRTGNAPGRRTA